MAADALFVNGGVTDAREARLDSGALIAVQGPTALDARTGVLAGPGSTALVTGTSATAPMSYAIAPHHAVTSRGASNGPYIGPTLDASTTVATTAAPGSGSRIDVIYVKQQDSTAGVPTPDGSTAPLYGVVQGTSSTGTPVKPALPVGAEELATATVTSSATATNGAGVTITNTARQTAARGGVIPVRTKAERDTIAAGEGQPVWRRDLNMLEVLSDSAGALAAIFGAAKIIPTTGTASGTLTNGLADLHSTVTISQPFGAGVPFQGLLYACSFGQLNASTVMWISPLGDPAANRSGRISATGTAQALVPFDSGSADSFAFKPVIKADGVVQLFADAVNAYSIAIAIPKALS